MTPVPVAPTMPAAQVHVRAQGVTHLQDTNETPGHRLDDSDLQRQTYVVHDRWPCATLLPGDSPRRAWRDHASRPATPARRVVHRVPRFRDPGRPPVHGAGNIDPIEVAVIRARGGQMMMMNAAGIASSETAMSMHPRHEHRARNARRHRRIGTVVDQFVRMRDNSCTSHRTPPPESLQRALLIGRARAAPTVVPGADRLAALADETCVRPCREGPASSPRVSVIRDIVGSFQTKSSDARMIQVARMDRRERDRELIIAMPPERYWAAPTMSGCGARLEHSLSNAPARAHTDGDSSVQHVQEGNDGSTTPRAATNNETAELGWKASAIGGPAGSCREPSSRTAPADREQNQSNICQPHARQRRRECEPRVEPDCVYAERDGRGASFQPYARMLRTRSVNPIQIGP